MNRHKLSSADRRFLKEIETCRFPANTFDHRAHLRLAYIYLALCKNAELSVTKTRNALCQLLRHTGLNPSDKYHETLTKAWVLTVNRTMLKTLATSCADELIDQHPSLLSPGFMLKYYSADRLYSPAARRDYLEPDIRSII